jgi:type I restriction enzyme R subunit
MAFTDINSEGRLAQETFTDHLRDVFGWESVYAFNDEAFGPEGTLGRADTKEVVLMRDLRAAIARLRKENHR